MVRDMTVNHAYGVKSYGGSSPPCRAKISRDSLMVRYWAHNPGTGKACLGSTPSPATNLKTLWP